MKQETQQQTANKATSQQVASQAQKSSVSAIDRLKEFGGFTLKIS